MEFVELTEEEYQIFWEDHPCKTFLSAPSIAKLRGDAGYDISFVGVKQDKIVVAATLLTSKVKKMGQKEFYAPRGFLIDYHDKEILEFFVQNIKKYIQDKKGFVLRIDPYVIYKERDINGNIVNDKEDNTDVVNHLKSLGFKALEEKDFEQVSWMFSLGLEGKTEDQILKEMKPNTRNTIRKTLKFGITIKELEYDELPRFLSIMEETGARKNFAVRKLDYYQNMYKYFMKNNEIKYLVTELDLKKYLKGLNSEIKEKEQKLNNLSDAAYNEGQKKSLNKEIESLTKRITSCEDIRKKAGKDVITLSGSMFILTKPEIIYLSSGNYTEYLQFNSQYLIQWEMIKYGIKHGYKKHNFYGIPANINEKPKDYGIYEFKRGFNGYVEELIGEFALPINHYYYLFESLGKVKKAIKH